MSPSEPLNSITLERAIEHHTTQTVACSRLSVSEDDRKRERATSGISSERDPGQKRRGRESL